MFELSPFRTNHIAAYDPFRELEELERAFFGSGNSLAKVGNFKTDIQDKGDHFLLEADLPGVDKSDIAIDLDGDSMTIRAERHSEHEDKSDGYLRCERSYGSYERSFDVSAVKTDEIKASYTDGVLKLTMPKKDAQVSTARRLEIE